MSAPRSYLVGRDVGHSISPAIHNTLAADAGIAWRYELLDVEPAAASAAIEGLRSPACTGANVTMPYKELAVSHADESAEEVRRCGATNLLQNRGGKLVAHNTDVTAVLACLGRRAATVRGADAVVIGAGGAAAAALDGFRAIAPRGVTVMARRPERAAALAERAAGWLSAPVRSAALADGEEALAAAGLVVNATSLGASAEDTLPFAAELLAPGDLFYDFVYGRGALSPLQVEARERGALVCDGAAHNLEQAVPSFELLSGATAARSRVREIMVEVIGREPLEWEAE